MSTSRWLLLLLLLLLTILSIRTTLAASAHLPLHLYRQTGRDSPLKIRPKPCLDSKGQRGQCMFVWDCIKGLGNHLGTCVDGFLFGTCCGHSSASSFPPLSPLFHHTPTTTSTVAPLATAPLMMVTIYFNVSNDQEASLDSRTPVLTSNQSSISKNQSMQSYWSYQNVHENATTTKPNVTKSPTTTAAPILKTTTTTAMPTTTTVLPTTTTLQTTTTTTTVRPTTATTTVSSTTRTSPTTTTMTTTTTIATTTQTTTTTMLPIITTTLPRFTKTTTLPRFTTTTTLPRFTTKTTLPRFTTTTTRPRFTTTTTLPLTSTTTTLPPTTTRPPLPTVSVASKTFHDCGIPSVIPQMRIVGGKDSRMGNWPWQVSVRRSTFFGFSSTHRCGGAVLNEMWVATAGHCVADLLLPQIRIRVGEYDLSSSAEVYPHVERGVQKRFVHANYNADTYEYDLALVRLDKPLDPTPNISPICLPNSDDILVGKIATITGWGRLKEGGTLPSVLQEVHVPIVSNTKCEQMFLSAGRRESIPDFFVCAGYEFGGKDSCQGDSGGPLQIKGEDGHWFLAGIISWGIGCGEPNLPGVCTRISKFRQWIFETIEKGDQ